MNRLRTRLRASIASGPLVLLDFISGGLDPRVTFTRSTTATFTGSNGLIQTAAINAPRFDYDPVTLAPKGLLIEEQRVNLLTYSEQFDNAAWTKQNGTLTANATVSPDGTTNADAFIENTTAAAVHDFSQVQNVTSGTAYTVTIYIKPIGSRTVQILVGGSGFTESRTWFNLSTLVATTTIGAVTAASVVAVGNGWYRCSVTQSATATASATILYRLWDGTTGAYTGNGTSGLYYYGAQLEAGAFATSYIPTVASQVTRSADIAVMTGTNFSSWYNQTQGTFVASADTASFADLRRNIQVDDGTSAERIYLGTNTVANPLTVVVDGGAIQANLPASATTLTVNTPYKIAMTYSINDFAVVGNGGTVAVDTLGTLPTVSQMRIGASDASIYLNGHIRQIAYYNTRLPNDTLQELTAPSLAITLNLDFINGTYDA
jgi:hypothetical protein